MTSARDDLANYAAKLKEDLDSRKPRIYAPVVWAYQDAQVRDAIASRLDAGEVLTSSSQIVPDRALRRERVYFAFAEHGRLDAKKPGILVQLNDDNTVAEIMDPFDLDQNAHVPIATTAIDTLPLFAARTSMPDQFDVDAEAVAALTARWTRFVQQAALARTFFPIWGGGFGGGVVGGVSGFANESVSNGTPTSSTVISSVGSKEDPDQDSTGGNIDDYM
jgi:hypothetical protein